MILQSLARLAQREGLLDDASYEQKPVQFAIEIGRNGEFVQAIDLRKPEKLPEPKPGQKAKKAKLVTPLMQVPRALPGDARTGSAPAPAFLVDNAVFVLGVDLSPDQRAAKREGECDRRREAFAALARSCATVTSDEALKALIRFLENRPALAAAVDGLKAKAYESNYLIAFKYQPEGQYIHLRDNVRGYWLAARAAAEKTGDATNVQCLVTGKEAAPVDKHDFLKGVPGGNASGVSLVSFNSNAFESLGWNRNENAPVSREAMQAYTTALNRLLRKDFPKPGGQAGECLPNQSYRLTADEMALWWAADDDGGLGNSVEKAFNPPADLGWIKDFLARTWTGGAVRDRTGKTPFYLLVLSGAQARATIRRFQVSTVERVWSSLKAYLLDVRNDDTKSVPPLFSLLRTMAVRGESDSIPKNTSGELYEAILTGRAFPESVLEACVRRARAEQASVNPNNRTRIGPMPLNRALLLRAYFNSTFRNRNQHGLSSEIGASMNHDHLNKGYLLGAMFACIERMQELALGEVGANVTDRYFGSACATPQAVFPRLLKTEVHHFRKARDGKWGGSAVLTHRRISDLSRTLVGEQNKLSGDETVESFLKRTGGNVKGFPAFLPLPQQGLFTLGYHQQRAEFFKTKEQREAEAATASKK
jgi:CRISPR-associated protein Csd1